MRSVRSLTDVSDVGTRRVRSTSFPSNPGVILPTVFGLPAEKGMMLCDAHRSPRQSLPSGLCPSIDGFIRCARSGSRDHSSALLRRSLLHLAWATSRSEAPLRSLRYPPCCVPERWTPTTPSLRRRSWRQCTASSPGQRSQPLRVLGPQDHWEMHECESPCQPSSRTHQWVVMPTSGHILARTWLDIFLKPMNSE